MKHLESYKKIGLSNEDEVFNYFMDNLKPSNRLWSYFVNWEKVFKAVESLEIELNTLNYLVGKTDFDKEFKKLIKTSPSVIKALPALAVRSADISNKFTILVDYQNKKLVYKNFDFSKQSIDDDSIKQYLEFIQETGIRDLLTSKKIKSLVDYMIGVEAGLDSNGRKNRGGHAMEDIVEAFVQDVCQEKGFKYLKEANANNILREFGIKVAVDKSSRRYDFVIFHNGRLSLIETNFYGGGGSKLKATAGEYRKLSQTLQNQHQFIWVTDGHGWKTTRLPLREAYSEIDYVFNLSMLENKILSEVI